MSKPSNLTSVRRASQRREYVTVKFTKRQCALAYTEFTASADNCDTPQLSREFQTLANKFRAVR